MKKQVKLFPDETESQMGIKAGTESVLFEELGKSTFIRDGVVEKCRDQAGIVEIEIQEKRWI